MRRLALISVCIGLLGGAASAQGELTQSEGLRVAFNGGFTPDVLPRLRAVPVTARLEGSFGTVNGHQPPPLREVSFAINRNGRLFTAGLPTCPSGLLQSTSSAVALSRCRPALVGEGSFNADVNFPNLPLVAVPGELLAFNGRSDGRPAILLHLYVSNPAKATLVLTFTVTRQPTGTFGTILSTHIPEIVGELGYITNISMQIGRRYQYRGHLHSLLSASCAAPAGFPGASFNFARGSFSFANGQRLTTTLTRKCHVL